MVLFGSRLVVQFLILVCLLSVCSLKATAGSKTFITHFGMLPGDAEVRSPNGLYSITNTSRQEKSGDQKHRLYFANKDGQTKVELFSFSRCVNIAWSPNSKWFVVNDWIGSNIAESYLYFVKDIQHPVDIRPLLMKSIVDKKEIERIKQSTHSYVSSGYWIKDDLLEVKIFGQNGGEYTFDYLWDLKNSFIPRQKALAQLKKDYFQTDSESKRMQICVDLINLKFIERGVKISELEKFFGTDLREGFPATITKLGSRVVNFSKQITCTKEGIAIPYIGWSLVVEYDWTGTIQNYHLTNTHK